MAVCMNRAELDSYWYSKKIVTANYIVQATESTISTLSRDEIVHISNSKSARVALLIPEKKIN
jgi:hypothetical protein